MIRKWISEISGTSISIFTITSTIGGALSYLFGPWNKTFAGLLALMALDVITGVMTALKKKSAKTSDGKLSSKAGTDGLFKKVGIIIGVMSAYVSGLIFLPETEQAILLRDAVMCGFAFFEIVSIFENLNTLGVKIPPVVMKFIKAIKKKVYTEEPTNPSNESLIGDAEAKCDEKEEEALELLILGKDESGDK